MRVGFLTPTFPPICFGIGIYSKNLVEALADKGVEIELVTGLVGDYKYPNVRVHNTNSFGTRNLALMWLMYFMTNTFFTFRLRKKVSLIHDNGVLGLSPTPPDVITVHYLVYSTIKNLRRYPSKMRYISTKEKLSYKLSLLMEKRLIKRPKALISLSPSLTRDIIEHYGIQKEKVFTIPNGINLSDFKPSKDKENFCFFQEGLQKRRAYSLF